MRSNFRGLKLSRMSQIRDFRVFIFMGPHPVPLFSLSKLTSDRPEQTIIRNMLHFAVSGRSVDVGIVYI